MTSKRWKFLKEPFQTTHEPLQIPHGPLQLPHEGRKTFDEAGKIAHEGHLKAPEALKVTREAVQVPPEGLRLRHEGLTTAPEGVQICAATGKLTLAVGFNPRKIVKHVLVGYRRMNRNRETISIVANATRPYFIRFTVG